MTDTPTTLLRTARNGCFQLRSNTWGSFLAPCPDPDANVQVTKEQLDGFELHDNIQRLPAPLWQAWVQLCLHLTERDRRNLEVSCRLLRREDDPSQWRIAIPIQEVCTASVRVETFDSAVDLITGEAIEHWPPDGWLPCGSSHSHNSMAAFFSGTDDNYEIGDPGLHIVVGTLDPIKRQYTLKASITANNRRYIVDHNAVVDTTPVQDSTYHPDVLNAISMALPTAGRIPVRFSQSRCQTKPGRSVWGLGFANPNAGNGYKPLPEWDDCPPWDPRQWDFATSDDVFAEEEGLIDQITDATNALLGDGNTAALKLLSRLKYHIESLIDNVHDIEAQELNELNELNNQALSELP